MIGRAADRRRSVLSGSDGLGEYRRSRCRLSTDGEVAAVHSDAASTDGRYLSAAAAIGRPSRRDRTGGPAPGGPYKFEFCDRLNLLASDSTGRC
jgi:hypothetical protein